MLKVVLLADRGFADVELRRLCQPLGGRYRLRIKTSFLVQRGKRHRVAVERLLPVRKGGARFFHYVSITGEHDGLVHLAVARPRDGKDPWLVVSDELTDLQAFKEDSLRFDIEENFLDDKSNGFQLESSMVDSAAEIERLFFGIASATLYSLANSSPYIMNELVFYMIVQSNDRR